MPGRERTHARPPACPPAFRPVHEFLPVRAYMCCSRRSNEACHIMTVEIPIFIIVFPNFVCLSNNTAAQHHQCNGLPTPESRFAGLDPKRLVQSLCAKKVDYTFGQITNHTEKMTEVFAKVYDGSQVSTILSSHLLAHRSQINRHCVIVRSIYTYTCIYVRDVTSYSRCLLFKWHLSLLLAAHACMHVC